LLVPSSSDDELNLVHVSSFCHYSGAVPSPFDCFLAQRGIKTLPLRALQHGLNALYIAKNLSSNPLIAEINYPGLASSEFYERAKWSLSQQAKKDLTSLGWEFDPSHQKPSEKEREQGGIPFSGMITIRLRATEAQTEKFLLTLRYFSLAESLGGVESLAEAPWKMTHGSIPEEERRKAGITEDLVRLSVGIEDKEDLLRDLENALRVAIQGGE
jgi:cystathionine gamma-lyase